MEQYIKILEDYINFKKQFTLLDEESERLEALENILKERQQDKEKIKELDEENKELISDNLEYQRTLDIFDKRTYRKKYLEERRNEEPNLLYPDSDEIYKRYYKLREENKEIEEKNKKNLIEIICYQEELENSIPVSLVEEKIEELNKLLEEDLQDERKVNSNRFIIICQCKSCLQELLEKRK